MRKTSVLLADRGFGTTDRFRCNKKKELQTQWGAVRCLTGVSFLPVRNLVLAKEDNDRYTIY